MKRVIGFASPRNRMGAEVAGHRCVQPELRASAGREVQLFRRSPGCLIPATLPARSATSARLPHMFSSIIGVTGPRTLWQGLRCPNAHVSGPHPHQTNSTSKPSLSDRSRWSTTRVHRS